MKTLKFWQVCALSFALTQVTAVEPIKTPITQAKKDAWQQFKQTRLQNYVPTYRVGGATSTVFINEIHYDNVGADVDEFIEIAGPVGSDLTGWSIVLYNGGDGKAYNTIDLTGNTLTNAANGFGFFAETFPANGIQNGAPDGVALVNNGTLVQFLSYEGVMTASDGPASGQTSTDIGVSENASTPQGHSLQLSGTGNKYGDFTWGAATVAATKGAANQRQTFSGGTTTTKSFSITATDANKAEGDSGTTAFTFKVSRSDSTGAATVNYSVSGSDINATDFGGAIPTNQAVIFADGDSEKVITVNVSGDTTQEPDETFTVTLSAPSTGWTLGTNTATGTIQDDDTPVKTPTVTKIHAIQGIQDTLAITAEVTIEGIAVADYQEGNELKGFFVQEEDADTDNNPLTSEGIYIYTGNQSASKAVALGDKVQIKGIPSDRYGNTNIDCSKASCTVRVLASNQTLPTPAEVIFPVSAVSDWERYEGMRVKLVGKMVATENYNLARYGEIVVSKDTRLYQPTQYVDPNDNPASGTNNSGTSNVAAVKAQQDLNMRSSVTLDDVSSKQNIADIRYFDATQKTLRLGSYINDLTGVVYYNFNKYRVLQDVSSLPNWQFAQRPTQAPTVGGDVKVASFNVLNYFTTFKKNDRKARGAWDAVEFDRQRKKIITAICKLDVDVVGLMEMENNGSDQNSAIGNLVDGLNGKCGSDWKNVVEPASWGTPLGTKDAIKVAIIYRSDAVMPVGESKITSSTAFDNGRTPIAQAFRDTTGRMFTLVVNHFKSKGNYGNSATGADLDQNDGQGFYNDTRKQQAAALATFIDTLEVIDPDVISIGDYNAYYEEDPIDTLRATGLKDLSDKDELSYVFFGQFGALDNALGTPSLAAQKTKTAIWGINSPEPRLIDYNVEYKDTPLNTTRKKGKTPDYYVANEFRSSDHDPVIIGLALKPINIDKSVTTADFGEVKAGETNIKTYMLKNNDAEQSFAYPDLNSLLSGPNFEIDTSGTCVLAGGVLKANESCTIAINLVHADTEHRQQNDVTGKLTIVGHNVKLSATLLSSLTIDPITKKALTLGDDVNLTLVAKGGTNPYTFSATGLPDGLVMSGNKITGKVTKVGKFITEVIVTDASTASARASTTVEFEIVAKPLVVTAIPAKFLKVGEKAEVTLAATGGVEAYSWAVSSASISNALNGATLTIMATEVGSFTVKAVVTDAQKTQASTDIQVTVSEGDSSLTILSSDVITAKVGENVNQPVFISGGKAPYQLSAAGLPDGLTLENGVISGIPTTAGKTSVTIAVTDADKKVAEKTVTIKVEKELKMGVIFADGFE